MYAKDAKKRETKREESVKCSEWVVRTANPRGVTARVGSSLASDWDGSISVVIVVAGRLVFFDYDYVDKELVSLIRPTKLTIPLSGTTTKLEQACSMA